MSEVVLINPFEVPEGKEAEALAYWDSVAEYMRRQPGFISTRLHKALEQKARFHFVNLAKWESAEAFAAATATEEFAKLVAPHLEEFPHFPALYEVVRG